MKPFLTTLLMAIVAAVASTMAWNYAPRNEVTETNIRIGQPLLEGDAAYDTGDVSRISIMKYDRKQDSAKRIELARVAGSWVIPDKSDFLASNAERISGVIDSLRDKEILDMPSDQQNDHEEYGVVDIDESGANRIGVGAKLILEDARRNPLAQVIVGNSADDGIQRFIRFPGQPQVYVIEFDENLLTTDFTQWVDGDLLRFGNQQAQFQQLLEAIEINYYFMDKRNTQRDSGKSHVYKARIYQQDGDWLYDLWVPDDSQQLDDSPTLSGESINLDPLRKLLTGIFAFQLRDVQRKAAETAQDLAEPAESNSLKHFDWLKPRGFQHAGFQNNQHQFDSLAGSIRIRYRNGNVDTLAIGDLAGLDMQNRNDINRFLLVTCGLDESVIPEPEDPGEDADDDARRDYQRQLNERNEFLELSRERWRSLNQVHADWLYVTTQEAVSDLFPPLESLAAEGSRDGQ